MLFDPKISLLRIGLAIYLALMWTVFQTHGAGFQVTDSSDDANGFTLRNAIILANSKGGSNTIILTNNTYILTILGVDEDASFSGDLDVTNGNLTIIGASTQRVTIDATVLGDRIFQVFPGTQLTLSNLVIKGGVAPTGVSGQGEDGGGIYNDGTLIMNNCVVTNNSSGVGASSDVFGSNGGDGGGIYNLGVATFNNCTMSANFSGAGGDSSGVGIGLQGGGGNGGNGGGIYNGGALMLTNCTVSGNYNGRGGGAGSVIYASGSYQAGSIGGKGGYGGNGGGIYNTNILILNNCTVSENLSGTGGGGASGGPGPGSGGDGGGIYNSGNMSLKDCTVAINSGGIGGIGGSGFFAGPGGNGGNGGGVFNEINNSSVNLGNSLIAMNTSGAGGNGEENGTGEITAGGEFVLGYWPSGNVGSGADLCGNFISQGYNLISQVDGSNGLTNGINNDLAGNTNAPINPLIGPLQDNGGPTFTHALLLGSPAIDQGSSFGLTTDQRGHLRPHDYFSIPNAPGGDGSDIGAFEADIPILNIRMLTSSTSLSWDTNCPGYTLEYTTNLTITNSIVLA
jgi:hypothetical protein